MKPKIELLEEKAKKIRYEIIRMIGLAGSGHPGGSLSAADIGVALFFHQMRYKPDNPKWEGRDRFILSKGHAAPLLYALLAEAGFFSPEHLATLRQYGSILQGHPASQKTPGVEVSTGSLGQGLSVGVGMALAGKMDGRSYNVYTLLGDGELDEGQVWEAIMSANHYRLDNLCAIVDRNFLQIDGDTEQVMALEVLEQKWKSFGWETIIINGHNMQEIIDALSLFLEVKNKPTVIIAQTVKGKGVSFMENKPEWHGKAPTSELLEKALQELALGDKQ